jgi:hypothetical protein
MENTGTNHSLTKFSTLDLSIAFLLDSTMVPNILFKGL